MEKISGCEKGVKGNHQQFLLLGGFNQLFGGIGQE
jgi:hypothetical protein